MSNSSLIPSYKIVLLGDSGVGKSSLTSQFVNNTFSEFQESTIGAAFFSKSFSVDNQACKLDIWDTAGQERYHSLTPMYYRGAKIAIVVFDLTKPSTYERMKEWSSEVSTVSDNIIITVVGNKTDLENDRLVAVDDARQFCLDNGFEYFECSAKNNTNIHKMFESSVRKVPIDEEITNISSFHLNSNVKIKKRCC